jgi:hypothetical protein
MNRWLPFMAIALVLAMFSTAMAFKNERKGFIMGFGMGIGVTTFTQSIKEDDYKITSPSENHPTLLTDFLIGGAPDSLVEVFVTTKISWFKMVNIYQNRVIVANAATGIGFSRYFHEHTPTWYITGGITMATWSLPFEKSAPPMLKGPGFFIGAGQEFEPHQAIEFDLIYGNPSYTVNYDKFSTSAWSFRVVFNAIDY